MSILRLLLLSLLLWNSFSVGAGNIVFRHLNMSDELSHYSVMALYQDEKGRIWMGTRNGVSVYDGDDVEVYKHSLSDSTSIHNSYIRDIVGNRKGEVYLLTNRGISSYHMKKDVFTTLYEGNVGDIVYAQDCLYMASGNQILRWCSDVQAFKNVYALSDEKVQISSLYWDGDNWLLGTEESGLYCYNQKKGELAQWVTDVRISDVIKDSRGRYWIGTWDKGIYLKENGELINHRYRFNDDKSLCADFVRKFCEDKQGNIWIGTFLGLNKYVEESVSFERFQVDSKTKLSHSSIWSLMCDMQGTMWVGTYFGGVNFFNASQTVCQHYIANEKTQGSLVVGTMVEDKRNQLWICTEGNGLCRLNPVTGETRWYMHDEEQKNSISHNNLKSIYYDEKKDVLWIGSHMGGLNRFDMKTERFTHYVCSSGEAASYKSSIVCDIVPYQDDLLLATHDGVYRFKPSDGSCMPMFKSGKEGYAIGLALDLHLDTQGVLWIAGTEKGVYAYDFKKENLLLHTHEAERSASLSSNGVNCLYEDSQNRLWVCMAESGVDLYQTETNGFENYSEENKGLLSNCVYGAYETGNDKLLFITDNGFAYFDYKTKQFRNFKANISLPLAGINQKSIYRASNGRIYIGGVDGLISFYPEELEEMTSEYQIFPSELYVNDRLIEVGDETGILENSLSDTRKITIDYEQNMFSLRYSVTNYVPLIQEEIVYKLENFSEEWSTLRNGRMITYTNLNPGTYTLIVKSDSGVEGTKQISRLEIEVLPPWFRTYWAYMGYLLVLIALLYIVMRFYKNRVKLQTELEYERKRIKDVENLNQYKLRFFTNISHEFRTPLTIIIGQMELLLQIKSFVPAVYNRMLNVYKSCVQLQSLVTELLDFRKQEQGHMKIKVSPHNIVAFLKENYLLFLEYAQTKEIEFKFEADEEDIEVWYDSKQMQKVVNNLLSNAFQYTPKGGVITLIVKKDEESVEVSVVDTGKGIKKSEISYIFDRFYQSEATLISSGKGTGIGLALTKGIVELHGGNISVDSEEGKGSVFTFRIPLGKMHFKTEEIVEEGADTTVVTATNEKQREDVILMEEEEQQMPEEISGNKTHKILVVEDEDGLRNMLVEIFSPYYIVEQASDGKEGLDKVIELQPDIVLSDVLMPTMSGIELCKQIKSNVDTCHIPVVLLTARTAIEHKLEGLQYGADDYIVKPFDLNILLARCRNLVNGRILLQEKFSKQPQTTAQLFATNPLDKIFMDKAMAIVENNLDNVDFNVNMFAKEMTIARTKLFVKLKAITGQTPNDFILTVRMKKAAFMLKNQPELNISEISDKAGFNSPRYFSRVFKERYNMTPQAYRKQAGQGDVELDSEDYETD